MNLRFYSFVNFYLSSIQQGVQSFHVLHEMFNKYGMGDTRYHDEFLRLHDWSKNDKTLIILNGGANTDIEEKYALLHKCEACLTFPMPFEKFHEDEKSLAGIITACGCVLPEEIYGAVDYRNSGLNWAHADNEDKNSFFFIKDDIVRQYHPGFCEHELITMIKSCSLAR